MPLPSMAHIKVEKEGVPQLQAAEEMMDTENGKENEDPKSDPASYSTSAGITAAELQAISDALSWHRDEFPPPAAAKVHTSSTTQQDGDAAATVYGHDHGTIDDNGNVTLPQRKRYPRSRIGRMEAEMLATQAKLDFLFLVLHHSEFKPRWNDVGLVIGTTAQNARIRFSKLLLRCGWELKGGAVIKLPNPEKEQRRSYYRSKPLVSMQPQAMTMPSATTTPMEMSPQAATSMSAEVNNPFASSRSHSAAAAISAKRKQDSVIPADEQDNLVPSAEADANASKPGTKWLLLPGGERVAMSSMADQPTFSNATVPNVPPPKPPTAQRSVTNYSGRPCMECRRRAIRCTRSFPACPNCVRRGVECVYNDEDFERPPRISSAGRRGQDLPCINCRHWKKLCTRTLPCESCVKREVRCSYPGGANPGHQVSQLGHQMYDKHAVPSSEEFMIGQQRSSLHGYNSVGNLGMTSGVNAPRYGDSDSAARKSKRSKVQDHNSTNGHKKSTDSPERVNKRVKIAPLAPDVAYVDDWGNFTSSDDDAGSGEEEEEFDNGEKSYLSHDQEEENDDEEEEEDPDNGKSHFNDENQDFEDPQAYYDDEGDSNIGRHDLEEDNEDNEGHADTADKGTSKREGLDSDELSGDVSDPLDDEDDPVALKVKLEREYARWQMT